MGVVVLLLLRRFLVNWPCLSELFYAGPRSSTEYLNNWVPVQGFLQSGDFRIFLPLTQSTLSGRYF